MDEHVHRNTFDHRDYYLATLRGNTCNWAGPHGNPWCEVVPLAMVNRSIGMREVAARTL